MVFNEERGPLAPRHPNENSLSSIVYRPCRIEAETFGCVIEPLFPAEEIDAVALLLLGVTSAVAPSLEFHGLNNDIYI